MTSAYSAVMDHDRARPGQVGERSAGMSQMLELDSVREEDQLSDLIELGLLHLREGRDLKALGVFDHVLAVSPTNRLALANRSRAVRRVVPRWHFAMLNDLDRNDRFDAALRRAVDPNHTVLDIGSGSGLLAMLAARHGARRVFSCEASSTLARTATEIVALNGFGRDVTILPKSSLEIDIPGDLPEPADVVISEIVDCGLLGEGVLPTLRHAGRHLLKPGGTMIPSAAEVEVALVESEQLWNLNRVTSYRDLDLTHFNDLSTREYFPVRLDTWRHRLLTTATPALHFDFVQGPIEHRPREIVMDVRSSGWCHGIVFWFHLDLGNSISVTNAPGTESHWMQAFQCFPHPIPVRQGQALDVVAHHDDDAIWFTPMDESSPVISGGMMP